MILQYSCCVKKLCSSCLLQRKRDSAWRVRIRGWRRPQATQSPCANHLDVPPQQLAGLCLPLFFCDAPEANPYLTPNRADLSSSGVRPSSIPSRIPSSRYPAYHVLQTASILPSTRLIRPLVLPCVVKQTRLYGSYGCRGTRPALPPRDGSTKGFVGGGRQVSRLTAGVGTVERWNGGTFDR